MARAMTARKLPLPAVGCELAVRYYVLEGNIRRSPEGIELNVQLSGAGSATSIWEGNSRKPPVNRAICGFRSCGRH
jgi:TolB-like protein